MSVDRGSARARVTELLGIEHPIVQGPFGGGYSTVGLAAAVSNGGGLGSYGAHVLAPAEIGAVVAEIRARTARPFAVNLWVPQPGERELAVTEEEFAAYLGPVRPHLERLGLPDPEFPVSFGQDFERQVEALLEARPPVFSFVMGVPPASVLAEARRRGIVTLGTATTVDEAVALDEAGVDAVVASGSDAGGHRGAWLRPVGESLVGTFSLVPQVVDAVSVPVVAAGGIVDGRGITAALALGAGAVQIGTGFLATDESGASPAHKEALHGPQARVTVLTSAFSGRQARTIANGFARDLAGREGELAPYPVQGALTAPLRRAAVERGLPDYLNLWAGQAAPLARPRTAREYLAALVEEAGL
ncbi:NAD(P)H-dependent flavin oxidoreductase [Streptomyces rubellomurinus]|uniref:Probable nitronate monooxygenase n=1 Tax=Streptomyces rubellomurinus (strain ATCC 31215) TaxID=359131 RepID=A0A0F2TA70_STRR3|nr:nitronate monooxygenase [Streptomyces rubellomurinus]KJS58642.1 2-nitropropane dioxygenase [Streptomyces rubellomurinus]